MRPTRLVARLGVASLLAIGLTGCESRRPPVVAEHELRVFAAASLADAFAEIGGAFRASRPDTKVLFNFGGSQNLRTQIEQGATADVFASANEAEMLTLVEGGFVDPASVRVFTSNTLILIVPEDNPAGLQTPQDLARAGTKVVLAAEEVPAGKYSRELIQNLGAVYGADFSARVMANVVSNEDNVRQVVAKVELGEADAGIVYASDAASAPALVIIPIPEGANVLAEYPIAQLVTADEAVAAGDFIDFVLSAEGQAIMASWGFSQVSP